MNELSQETSPYLLQHAQNPVHWKAWNESALAQAQYENKLIIVSIGYSACHWCHVMEHETFENDEAAAVMNAHFVAIKVDREERPDVDAVYMKAVQIMTGRGGWPLNAICLPDGRPVWGGTYFRQPEWIASLEQLQELWLSNPEKMVDYAQKLQDGLVGISVIEPKNQPTDLNLENLAPLVEKWQKSFDWEFGGMARAPKFMMPNNYRFLMHYGFLHADQKLLDFVDLTLTRMAWGGLFDTVGGGFSRYSVDMKWHVPHFEKMLYDNGQLTSLYADAFKRTQNPLYREVIEKTLDFVLRELTAPNGAFYSALDADSLDAQGHLEEGTFYIWTQNELQDLLAEDFALFSQVFNLNDFGHWEHGNYVLIQNETIETIAAKNGIAAADLQSKKNDWERLLWDAREKRSRPRLDDKCLTSWNAIMCKGFVDAYKAFGHEHYLQAAVANAQFLVEKQWSAEGHLWHSYKDGKSTINGYLEDYAHTAEAFVALYQATFEESWLHHAKQLVDYCFDHFYDAVGFFRFTSNADAPLIAPHFETEGNVIPASNSVLAHVLWCLSVYFEHTHYETVARKMLEHMATDIDYPSAYSNWLILWLQQSNHTRELAICGPNAVRQMQTINKQYWPHVLVGGAEHYSGLPFLAHRFDQSQTLFYVCQNRACQRPTDNIDDVNKDLNPYR